MGLIMVIWYALSTGNFIPLWGYCGCLALSMILTALLFYFRGDDIYD